MHLAEKVLAVNDDLPIHTDQPVHSGKVRSVYWLTKEDSRRLIDERNYDVAPDAELAIMVISDRLSAFDCIWQGENGLSGVPGKGAALNSISAHWFNLFNQDKLAGNHILETPHPLVWIVTKARPVMIEAIARQYITGSMWRAYSKGERDFCGIALPDGLKKDQKLPELLMTPSTKGIMKGILGVPEVDDCNISRENMERHFSAFKFNSLNDIALYEKLLNEGFNIIAKELNRSGQILVDTKFEFGYIQDRSGWEKLIYMDEVGTPDSSRIWDKSLYQSGTVLERSKEGFRQQLLEHVPEPDVLLNSDRMKERLTLARETHLPVEMLMDVSSVYREIAEKITGRKMIKIENPRQEVIDVLSDTYNLITK